MLQWLQENIPLFISLFGGGALLTAAASIVKAFSQKKLNKAFDLFNSNQQLQKLDIGSFVGQTKEIIVHLENKLSEATKFIGDLENRIVELNDKIGNDILVQVDKKLNAIAEVANQNQTKDELIARLAKDLKEIKIKLEKK